MGRSNVPGVFVRITHASVPPFRHARSVFGLVPDAWASRRDRVSATDALPARAPGFPHKELPDSDLGLSTTAGQYESAVLNVVFPLTRPVE